MKAAYGGLMFGRERDRARRAFPWGEAFKPCPLRWLVFAPVRFGEPARQLP